MRLLIAMAVLFGAMLMLALPTAEIASAVELLDAELVAAGSLILRKTLGAMRGGSGGSPY